MCCLILFQMSPRDGALWLCVLLVSRLCSVCYLMILSFPKALYGQWYMNEWVWSISGMVEGKTGTERKIFPRVNFYYIVGGTEQTSGGVPYVNLYRKTPKHLYPKLNGLGDNGQWSLKLWQLLHTYWLPNSYWNWHEYVVSVILISVLFIKVTCEWHKAINCNCKIPRIRVILILTVRSTIHHTGMLSGDVTRLPSCCLLWLTMHSRYQLVHWMNHPQCTVKV